MGMFDEVKLHKKHMPKGYKNHLTGWQTKDYMCHLGTIHFDKTGKMNYITGPEVNHWVSWYGDHVGPPDKFTGKITFYDFHRITKNWVEMEAVVKKGQLIEIKLTIEE